MGDGLLPDHVMSRVRRCVELGKTRSQSMILFSSSYTLNKPPVLDDSGYPLSEASAMARQAKALGCNNLILCEQQSHDTIGSAYFVFSHFVALWHPDGLSIVTSKFHLERTKVIFSHVASLFDYTLRNIDFEESDEILFPDRENAEQKSLEKYKKQWLDIKDRADYGRKLFQDHTNYNVDYSSRPVSSQTLKTY